MAAVMPEREVHIEGVISSLRDLAARLSEIQGLRVEIIGGNILVSPTPSFKHGKIVLQLIRQLDPQLPADRMPQPSYSVESVEDDEDYCSPDLMIVPEELGDEEGWLAPADIVDMAVEVVSKGNVPADTTLKPRAYARWGIPIYLMIDPRNGDIVLYSDPVDGRYRGRHDYTFGDTVTLPAPLAGISIESKEFPRYGG